MAKMWWCKKKKRRCCIRKRTSQNANRRHHKFCHFQDSTLRDSSQTAPTHDCIIREKLLSKNYIVAQVRTKIKRAAIVLEVLFVGPRKRPPDGHYSKTYVKIARNDRWNWNTAKFPPNLFLVRRRSRKNALDTEIQKTKDDACFNPFWWFRSTYVYLDYKYRRTKEFMTHRVESRKSADAQFRRACFFHLEVICFPAVCCPSRRLPWAQYNKPDLLRMIRYIFGIRLG